MAVYRWIATLTLLVVLAACQSEPQAPPRPTVIAFPTATAGSVLTGLLPTPMLSGVNPAIANPAADLFNPSTAVPNTEDCPALNPGAELSPLPEDAREFIDEILRFLSDGGDPDTLEEALRDDWGILDTDGFVLADLDMNGRGSANIFIGYTDPETGGVLLIAGCENRAFVEQYRYTSDAFVPPQLITIGDINNDSETDALFAFEQCPELEEELEEDEERDDCTYLMQIVSWQPRVERFVGLISGGLTATVLPEVTDTDDDTVRELLFRLTYIGDINTGPLRTGVKIYDWNGTEYVLSIAQPDAPVYQVQIIHEADRYFAQRRMADAVRLYQRVLTDDNLRIWLRNETPTLEAYTLYRLLLARAYNNDIEAQSVYDRLIAPNPEDPEAPLPIYAELGRTFWEIYQITGNVSEACADVRALIRVQPDAVDFMNRYGDRNPTYTEQDICPF